MPARQATADLVLAALQDAGRPQRVAEIRERVREASGVALRRDAVYSALVRLCDEELADFRTVYGSAAYLWFARPTTGVSPASVVSA